jgi:hypothetical protein
MTPEQALAAYDALPAPLLKKLLVLEYRCAHRKPGCLLLHVWNTPRGRLYYLSRYRLSPTKATTETAETARQKRTEDGLRTFRARAGSFDDLLDDYAAEPDAGLSMNCAHLRNVFIGFDRLAADASAGQPGRANELRVSSDGTVSA